jgi:hypothetical protein
MQELRSANFLIIDTIIFDRKEKARNLWVYVY